VDPADESAVLGAPQTWNRFTHASNAPQHRIDRNGRKDEYSKYRSTKSAIVTAYRRFQQQSNLPPNERGAVAYENARGSSHILAETTSTPGSCVLPDLTSDVGRFLMAEGYEYRGDAHVHPDGGSLSGSDLELWERNNLLLGIVPADSPDAAVDAYVIMPDGTVIQVSYSSKKPVTTIQQLEQELVADDLPMPKEQTPQEAVDDGSGR
jgi:hypothetical protein